MASVKDILTNDKLQSLVVELSALGAEKAGHPVTGEQQTQIATSLNQIIASGYTLGEVVAQIVAAKSA